MPILHAEDLNFDLDHHLNRIIPRSRLHLLPKPISWVLGHRDSGSSPPRKIGNLLVWWWAFIGAFVGLLVVEAVFQTKYFKTEGTPIVIASLGAAAILNYNTIDTPLSQPRNAILGQTLSATIGISLTKLFLHTTGPEHFLSLRWIVGALSVGLASAIMGLTNTIHPPAGATALLCSTSDEILVLGWFFLPLIVLGSTLLVAVGCLVNNIQRQYPFYWWTPADLGPRRRGGGDDIERVSAAGATTHKKSDADAASRGRGTGSGDVQNKGMITIDTDRILVPDWLPLDSEERYMLEILRVKLREGEGSEREGELETTRSGESEATKIGA